jgi:hypothetical protein
LQREVKLLFSRVEIDVSHLNLSIHHV